jgi:hypothetical protein
MSTLYLGALAKKNVLVFDVIRIIYAIFNALVEEYDSVVSKVKAQAQPRSFNCNIMNTPKIVVCRKLREINIAMKTQPRHHVVNANPAIS